MIIFSVLTLANFVVIVGTYFSKRFYIILKYTYCILLLRFMVLNFDFADRFEKHIKSYETWSANVITTSMVSMYGIMLYFYHFDKKDRLHFPVGMGLIIFNYVSIVAGARGGTLSGESKSKNQTAYLFIFYAFFIYLSFRQHF
mmetsp:Transcript_11868/g.18319  ORF Transcript_11868/g.18319 Transcript_11868/m.18319 type:complete len:143 (+) Transcript_11868:184-612(+)